VGLEDLSMSKRAWRVVEVWKGLGAVSSIGRECVPGSCSVECAVVYRRKRDG
jgi:hypothetical protein